MSQDKELDLLVKEMNYNGCGFCKESCDNDWCASKPKTLKERLAECIESYLTETDTSDIFENADYHGRILSSILISEGFVEE